MLGINLINLSERGLGAQGRVSCPAGIVETGILVTNHVIKFLRLRKFRAHTLAAYVMESPTHWLHGFIFRHD